MRSDRVRGTERADAARIRARDVALRRSRVLIGGVAAGAVVVSGVLSAVAAQAFKGHARKATTSVPVRHAGRHARTTRIHVPLPQPIPQIGPAAPLQPPAAPPSAAPAPTAAAPVPTAAPPQVSGGS